MWARSLDHEILGQDLTNVCVCIIVHPGYFSLLELLLRDKPLNLRADSSPKLQHSNTRRDIKWKLSKHPFKLKASLTWKQTQWLLIAIASMSQTHHSTGDSRVRTYGCCGLNEI